MSVSTCAPICFRSTPRLSQPRQPSCGLDRFPSSLHHYCLFFFLDVFHLVLPSFALFSSPPLLHPSTLLLSPDFHRHVLSRLSLLSFFPLPFPSLLPHFPTPSCSPLRQIDAPPPRPSSTFAAPQSYLLNKC